MLLSLVLALALPLVSANCGYENAYPDWYCQVCGGEVGIMDGPEGCAPNNATFDDLKPGALNGLYDNAIFSGFEVVQQNATLNLLRHLKPYSKPNYAKVPAGKTGVLSFQVSNVDFESFAGFLYSLHYGCSLPILGTPTSCTVEVEGYCQVPSKSLAFQYYNQTLDYGSANLFNNNLEFARSTGPTVFSQTPGACYNFTFTAVSKIGTPVDLFLDDIIYGTLFNQPPI